nr:unnamed protein product [Callosobruchus chinensis]
MEFLIGGLAATSAGVLTNPLEVVKHHMEVSKKANFGHQKGFLHTGYQVAKRDGLKSLQKGLSPALGAHLVSYGMKLGTYEFLANRGLTYYESGEVCVPKSIMASTCGGLMGQYFSNPFYLLKTEHAEHQHLNPRNYLSYTQIAKKIYQERGIRGFFRGATTSLPRALIGTSQLTSFAVAKETLNKFDLFAQQPFFTTILAAAAAGMVLSVAMTPFDLVLTKMYKQAIFAEKQKYSGYLDCMFKIYLKKGLKPFYKGMGPLYLKLGPHTVLCLVFWEELKDIYRKNTNAVDYNSKSYKPVPSNTFYEKIGFLSGTHDDYFNQKMESESKLGVYWN